MITRPTLLLAALVVSTSALASPSPATPPSAKHAASRAFAGSIDIKVFAPQDAGGVARLHLSDAGVSTEVDMGAMPGAPRGMRLQTRTLTRKDSTSFWVIDDKTKSYREIGIADVREAARRPASETWRVKKVGDATIAGFPAQHVVATSSLGLQLELWTTNAIGTDEAFVAAFVDQAKLSTSLMGALERNGLDGIPAKMLARTPQGEVGMEITAVKRGAPPKQLFEVPAGYKRLTDPAVPAEDPQPRRPNAVQGKLTL